MPARLIETEWGQVHVGTVQCARCNKEVVSDDAENWFRVSTLAESGFMSGSTLYLLSQDRTLNPVRDDRFCSIECLAETTAGLHTFKSEPLRDVCLTCGKSGLAHEQKSA